MKHTCAPLTTLALFGLFAAPATAQRNRIDGPIRVERRAPLAGHVPAQVRAGTDQGRVARDLRIRAMSLVLKPSDSQQADLDRLLIAQQDPTSPNYHRWLTPEEYADRFGV